MRETEISPTTGGRKEGFLFGKSRGRRQRRDLLYFFCCFEIYRKPNDASRGFKIPRYYYSATHFPIFCQKIRMARDRNRVTVWESYYAVFKKSS